MRMLFPRFCLCRSGRASYAGEIAVGRAKVNEVNRYKCSVDNILCLSVNAKGYNTARSAKYYSCRPVLNVKPTNPNADLNSNPNPLADLVRLFGGRGGGTISLSPPCFRVLPSLFAFDPLPPKFFLPSLFLLHVSSCFSPLTHFLPLLFPPVFPLRFRSLFPFLCDELLEHVTVILAKETTTVRIAYGVTVVFDRLRPGYFRESFKTSFTF